MKLQDHERTTGLTLQVRVMRRLLAADAGELLSTATLGAAGWPSNNLKAQGLAFAIGPTLAILRKQNLIGWCVVDVAGGAKFWGWTLTKKGHEVAKALAKQ